VSICTVEEGTHATHPTFTGLSGRNRTAWVRGKPAPTPHCCSSCPHSPPLTAEHLTSRWPRHQSSPPSVGSPPTSLPIPAPEQNREVRPAIATQHQSAPQTVPNRRAGDSPHLITALPREQRLSANGTPPGVHLEPSRTGRKPLLLEGPHTPRHKPTALNGRHCLSRFRHARALFPSASLKAALKHARRTQQPTNQNATRPAPAVCELKAGSAFE